MSVSFVAAYQDPNDLIYSIAQGSFIPLPGAAGNNAKANEYNRLSSYGLTSAIKELGPSGDVRWSAEFGATAPARSKGLSTQTYRVFKQQ